MKIRPLVLGGYASLVLAGWAAGHWLWPAAGELPQATGGNNIHAGAPVPTPGPAPDVVQKTPLTPAVDGTAAGLELRAAGSDAAFRDRARQMALEPPPALTDFLAAVTDSETVRTVLLEDAVVWAYCRNPEKGLALLSSLKDRAEVASLTKKALHFFPPKDLPVVLAWFHGRPEDGLKAAAREELVKVLAGRDFGQAVGLVASMPAENEENVRKRRRELLELAERGNAVMDPEKRAALMDASRGWLPEDLAAMSQKAEERKMVLMQSNDREAVVERLATVGDGGSALKTADFFTTWATSDPIRAAQGLEKLPADRKTPETYRQFAAKWAEGNVGMASQWVKDLPEGEARQAGVQGLVGTLAVDYPAEAVIWAGTLTDERVKLSELRRVLARAGSGPQAEKVQQAIAGLNLTAEQRAGLTLTTTP